MSESKFTFASHVDWLTVTGKYPPMVARNPPTESTTAYVNAVSIITNIFKLSEYNFDVRGAGRFYEWYFQDSNRGIRIDISSRARQGYMVQFQGKFFSGDASVIVGLLDAAATYTLQITRLDAAIDVFHTAELPRDVFEALRPTADNPPRRKLDFITSKTGETLAIGSRDSRFYLRIYDKSAEQGVDFTWVRVELEVKQDAAHALLGLDEKTIMRRAAAKSLEMMEGYSGNLSEAVSLVADGLAPLSSHSRPDTTDTERWIMATVLPALKKFAVQDHDGAKRVYERLMREWIPLVK